MSPLPERELVSLVHNAVGRSRAFLAAGAEIFREIFPQVFTMEKMGNIGNAIR